MNMAARRGTRLTVKELKALPDGTTVWFTYLKDGARHFRIDCRVNLTRKGENQWELVTPDGVDEFEFVNSENNPTLPAWDHACHTGESYLYWVEV